MTSFVTTQNLEISTTDCVRGKSSLTDWTGPDFMTKMKGLVDKVAVWNLKKFKSNRHGYKLVNKMITDLQHTFEI